MKIYRVTIICFFLFFAAGVFAEQSNIAWVNTPSGVILRSEASSTSYKEATIPYGSRVKILKQSGITQTFDGITDHWAYIEVKHSDGFIGYGNTKTGWVFGGFLTKDVIRFQGMHLPRFARLWSLGWPGDKKVYNNEEDTEILEYIKSNKETIVAKEPTLCSPVKIDATLERHIRKRGKRYGMNSIKKIKSYNVFNGDTLIIADGTVDDDSGYGNNITSYVTYKSINRKAVDDVIVFPTFEYSGHIPVFLKGEFKTTKGSILQLFFESDRENIAVGKAFLTLMNKHPHLYFYYVEGDSN